MKIIFFGSSNFAVPSLERLLKSGHEILAVVTQPDRKKGRQLKVQATPVKKVATSKKIKIYQPEDVKDASFQKSLKAHSADLFVVVAFGQILPKEVLETPKLYSINLHASLLPKYRGAAPINKVITDGAVKTGLTIIRMNEKMDAGDIMLQGKVVIEKEDTSESLEKKLSSLGSILLFDAVRFIEKDNVTLKRQDEKKASFAPSLKKEDGLIDWQKNALDIHNMIRGLVPWPCAFTFLDDKILKLWKSETLPSYANTVPGQIVDVSANILMVACGKGLLLIKELQLEGGKRMDIENFLRGHKLEKGAFLGKQDKELA